MRMRTSDTGLRLEVSDNHHSLVRLGEPIKLTPLKDAPKLTPQDDSHTWKAGEYIRVTDSELPDYTGAYEADARFTAQTFPTSQKVMRDDFTVKAINYTEAPNGSGITVTIGG